MFCHFLVGCVSVSGDLCLSCGLSLGVATVSSLTGGHDLRWHNEAHQFVKGVCGKDLLASSVIAIWLVLLLLSGFGCFWFGTLTALSPILLSVLSNGSLLLLSSCSLV